MVPTLLVAALLTVNLTIVLATKSWRPAAAWGALWGVAIGFWTLASPLMHADRISPATLVEWLALTVTLAVAFAVIGAVLTLAAIAPVALWTRPRGHTDDRREVALAVVVPVVLVPAYLAGSLGIESLMLSAIRWPTLSRSGTSALVGYAAASIVLLWIARQSLRHGPRLRVRTCGAVLGVVLTIGAASLPLRSPAPASRAGPAATADLVESEAGERPRVPLLVVGLDSASWDTLQPLMAQGRLPVLAALRDQGVSGTVHAEYPPYWSAPAWASILTGFPQADVGVYENLTLDIPGLPPFEVKLESDFRFNPLNLLRSILVRVRAFELSQHPREALARAPVWELLSRQGVQTAVVRFPFTYPAAGGSAFMVSNRINTEGWEAIGVRPGHPDAVVFPSSLSDRMRAFFVPDDRRAADLLQSIAPLDPWPNPRDARTDLRAMLRSATETDSAALSAAHEFLRMDPPVPVVMVYLSGFDIVAHAFWPYRFPESYPVDPPAADDVERLGGVIDAYLEYLDREIGRLMGAFPERPNVMIVSDHGNVATDDATLWRSWHGPEGAFIAGGPDIAGLGRLTDAVAYADIVPTILSLQGLRAPSLPGRVLVEPPVPATSVRTGASGD